jgi:hypothetical protein
MHELHKALSLRPVLYITRDIERALGIPISTKNYFIVTNSSPFAKQVAKGHKNVVLIAKKKVLDTHELLSDPRTKQLLKKTNGRVMVFKNTTQIEKICAANGWQLLNPKAELANRVEQKLSQLQWLGPLRKYLPPHKVMKCKELSWPLNNNRTIEQYNNYIIQFNHAHTGLGTILVESQKQIGELKNKFPNREVRVTQFISGAVFTNNNVVWGKKILCGNINFQITGLKPFTDQPFATVGNDWAFAHRALNAKQLTRPQRQQAGLHGGREQFKQIATDVGKRLMKDGWKGLFGIDIIMDEKTGRIYLLEINARQPASTTFESQLQENKKSTKQKNKVTTFEAHVASLVGLKPNGYSLIPISDGAQIVQRVIASDQRERGNPLAIKKLRNSGFNVIEYNNTKPGEDLLRIQSTRGIMKNQGEFNEVGEKIIQIPK